MRLRPPNLTNSLAWLGIAVLALSFYVPYWTAERVARAEGRALEASRALLELALARDTDLTDETQTRALFDAFHDWAVERNLPSTWYPERVEIESRGDLPIPPGLTARMKHYMLRLSRTPLDKLTPIAGRASDPRPTASTRASADRTEAAADGASDEPEPAGDEAAPGAGLDAQADATTRPSQTRPWPGERPTDADEAPSEPEVPPREPFEVHAWPAGNLGAGYTAFYMHEDGLAAYTRNKAAKYQGLDRVPAPGDGQPRPGADNVAPDPRIERTYRNRKDERWILFLPGVLDEPSDVR